MWTSNMALSSQKVNHPDSQKLQILRPRWKKLAECSQYYPDPAPNHPMWTGQPLHCKSSPR